MNIALIHYAAPPVVGGVESVLAQQARLMARAGHEVRVIAGRGEGEAIGVPLISLPLVNSRHPSVLALKKELDAGRVPAGFAALRDELLAALRPALAGVAVVVAHNVCSLNKNLALTAALHDLSQEPGGSGFILWHHDLAWTTPRYRPELHEGYPWDLLRTDWPNVAQVVVSEARRQELAGLWGAPAGRIEVVPNGVSSGPLLKLEAQTQTLIEQLCLTAAQPLLLLPARLTPRKNIELALQVLAALRREMPQAALLVTGPEGPHNPANAGYRARLLALRDKLGLAGAAHFAAEHVPEALPDAVVADLLRLADALILPSREEGFGIPLIEAALTRLPVFCADIAPLRELGGDDVSVLRAGRPTGRHRARHRRPAAGRPGLSVCRARAARLHLGTYLYRPPGPPADPIGGADQKSEPIMKKHVFSPFRRALVPVAAGHEAPAAALAAARAVSSSVVLLGIVTIPAEQTLSAGASQASTLRKQLRELAAGEPHFVESARGGGPPALGRAGARDRGRAGRPAGDGMGRHLERAGHVAGRCRQPAAMRRGAGARAIPGPGDARAGAHARRPER